MVWLASKGSKTEQPFKERLIKIASSLVLLAFAGHLMSLLRTDLSNKRLKRKTSLGEGGVRDRECQACLDLRRRTRKNVFQVPKHLRTSSPHMAAGVLRPP